MKKILFIILFCLASCGKIKVETNVPKKMVVTVGPDFIEAARFCDERYGKLTIEAEVCFKDYRTFLSPKVTLDLASIQNFCKGSYSTPEDIESCENDLITFILPSLGIILISINITC